MTYF